MKKEDVFPSNYLNGALIKAAGGKIQTSIVRVEMQTIETEEGKEEKPVAILAGETKPLILNVTNWKALSELFGDESDLWKGKPVTLVAIKTEAFGKQVDAVRVQTEF